MAHHQEVDHGMKSKFEDHALDVTQIDDGINIATSGIYVEDSQKVGNKDLLEHSKKMSKKVRILEKRTG